jgi:5-methylcytosine-specific restriction endonuclease McrA
MRKGGGKLKPSVIQLVYEDNIKKYGTLTCYLCELPIVFGNDHLEHKTPLSRGGNNEYNNLGVSCRDCNLRKWNKTVEEYQSVCHA